MTAHSTKKYPSPSPRLWRTLDEYAGTDAFEAARHREFSPAASVGVDSTTRRQFLKLMGASFALGGLSACRPQAVEKIAPYVRAPEEVLPGEPLFYASSLERYGYAQPILVETHMGRPTKIEGHPSHPASLGATDLTTQAAVLELWDPERTGRIVQGGGSRTVAEFKAAIGSQMAEARNNRGDGLHILTAPFSSPLLAARIARWRRDYPQAHWYMSDPMNRGSHYAASEMAFGRPLEIHEHWDKAEVILVIDGDPFSHGPGKLSCARNFMKRRGSVGIDTVNRLFVLETTPGLAGAAADERMPVRPSWVSACIGLLEDYVAGRPNRPSTLPEPVRRWIQRVTEELMAHRGRGLVMPGPFLEARTQARLMVLNAALSNTDTTLTATTPVLSREGKPVAELLNALGQGSVRMLVMLGVNPVYELPTETGFEALLRKVPLSIQATLYPDETSQRVTWHLPLAHPLESWGAQRAEDGSICLQQPTIEPLRGGLTTLQILEHMLGGTGEREDLQLQKLLGAGEHWKDWLRQGAVPNSAFPPIPFPKALALPDSASTPAQAGSLEALEIVYRPDPTIGLGESANLGWLQECPKPLTQLTWTNAALLGPATAQRMNVKNGDIVSLRRRENEIAAPVWLLPGQPDGVVTLHLGYGRRAGGIVGQGRGIDTAPLRSVTEPWSGAGVSLKAAGRHVALPTTQHHHLMEGRELVRVHRAGSLPEVSSHRDEIGVEGGSLYPGFKYPGQAWGMVINLSACIGCKACVVACQAENNIPVVGPEQVTRGREMHWIRVDLYHEGDPANPRTHHQPVPCMHCENAPCEVVCPVAATTHSAEGLNEMTYNRCIGTRYCSNNCPYKVRRFNFLQYTAAEGPLQWLRNPDVTLRSRGVMEKCTYCVQRINRARIRARKEDRKVADGEIRTACQAVCPTEAITFGDIKDVGSRVSALRRDPLHYGLLTELNTRPRTTYLQKVVNPLPARGPADQHS